MKPEKLAQWVIYHKPKDFPGIEYMARRWETDEDGSKPTNTTMIGTLRSIREACRDEFGLVCVPRDPQDDPCIIEVWL